MSEGKTPTPNTMTTNTTHLIPSAITKKAHAIRKELGESLGLPASAMKWKYALKAAKNGTKLRDAWGFPLGSIVSNINFYLWSGDCALNICPDDISEATGCTLDQARNHLADLDLKYGCLTNCHGFVSVKNTKRPWPQPTLGEKAYYNNTALTA